MQDYCAECGKVSELKCPIDNTLVCAQHLAYYPSFMPLHPVGTDFTSTFGQRPSVLALQPRDQARHILSGPASRFRSREPSTDPRMQRIEFCCNDIHHHAGKLHETSAVAVLVDVLVREVERLI